MKKINEATASMRKRVAALRECDGLSIPLVSTE